MPKEREANPIRLQQRSDARLVKKKDANHDGYKNNIIMDADHSFMRRYTVNAANIHDSQMLSRVLDLENNSTAYELLKPYRREV